MERVEAALVVVLFAADFFFAEVFFDADVVAFFADDLRGADFVADDFLDDGFFGEDFFEADLAEAADFEAGFFDVDFFALDFFDAGFFVADWRAPPFFAADLGADAPRAAVRSTSLLKRFPRAAESSMARLFRSNQSKNSSHPISSSDPSPENPGKSMRRMPGSLPRPVAFTRAGRPPRASTHFRISS